MSEFFKHDPSLFQQEKLTSLAFKQAEKTDRLLGTPTFIPEEQGFVADLVDLGQSSFYNEVGVDADAGKNLSNALFGSDFDSDEETGFSNRANADLEAGVSPEFRQSVNDKQHQVAVDIANRDYGSALFNAIKVAPETAVDSLGSMLGLAAGVVTTRGVGAVASGKRKLESGKRTIDKIKGLRKIVDAGGSIGKVLAQTSLINVSQTQRKVYDYQRENNGERPSAERLAVMVLGSAITNSAELGIIKKFFLPSRKQSLDEITSVVRAMKPNTSAIKSIATRVREGITKVAAAGGAEGIQEYLQTWDQILSVKVNPENGQTMFEAVMIEVNKTENQNEAATGGLLGLGAGGAIKTAGVVPSVVVGSAVDTAVGTTKTAFNLTTAVAVGAANRSARKKLSPEEKRDLNTRFKAEKQDVNTKTTKMKQQRSTVNKAKSVEALMADEQLAPLVQAHVNRLKITDEQLATKAGLTQLKKAMNITFDKSIKTLNDTLDNSNLSHFKSRSGKPSKTASQPSTEVETDTLADTLSSSGPEVVQAAQELESSAAVSAVNEIIKNPEQVSDQVVNNASQLSAHDLERVAAIAQKTNPKTAKILSKLARNKTSANRRFAPSKNTIVDKGNIDEQLKHTASNGITSNTEVSSLSIALSSALGKKLGDLETVATLKKALQAYKEHPTVRKQGKGIVHNTTLAKWEKRLDAAELRLSIKDTKTENSEDTKDKPSEEEQSTSDTEPSKEEEAEVVSPEPQAEGTSIEDRVKGLSAAISLSIKNKVDLKPIRENMPKVVAKLVSEGYNNKKDFDQLLKDNPGLSEDPEILNALTVGLSNPTIQEAVTETAQMTKQQIDDAYTKLYPGCKI